MVCVIPELTRIEAVTEYCIPNTSGVSEDPYHGNEGSGRLSKISSNQIESMKNEETGGAVVESAVTLDGLGVVITDGGKNECCSSVSVGLKAGLNQKQVDEKIILWIVNSSHFGSRMWVGSEEVEVEGEKGKRTSTGGGTMRMVWGRGEVGLKSLWISQSKSEKAGVGSVCALSGRLSKNGVIMNCISMSEGVPLVLGESGSERLLPVLLSSTSPDYCFAIQGLPHHRRRLLLEVGIQGESVLFLWWYFSILNEKTKVRLADNR
ncbi:hypothetical protein BLNAU_11360 [Blattamonas nauphoetae]|uniref:Uncharacterized protein n=1 Tax=Blattamonas nauphoetae TaxID=2049346 RepID=A0ABQ9XQ36_9EUKA|nr:hypothetical protein BLNAU_11360 [Blattamonas nauphoetae]